MFNLNIFLVVLLVIYVILVLREGEEKEDFGKYCDKFGNCVPSIRSESDGMLNIQPESGLAPGLATSI